MARLENSCRTLLKVCMGLKVSESLLVLTDDSKLKIGQALYKVGKGLCNECYLVVMKPREINGEEPPKVISELMKKFDVVVMPLLKSLSHTKARKDATAIGVRIASMPTITEDMIARAMSADYYKIREVTKRLGMTLKSTSVIRITSKIGTDITMRIKGKKIHGLEGGIFNKKGMWGNLPEGEACLAPIEGSSNGVFIVDRSFAGIGKVNGMLKVYVKDGYVCKVEGKDSKRFWRMFESLPKKALNIAELGIGTNDKAKVIGIVLEDEKVMGTAHIAVGNNMSFEGTHNYPIHVDGVFSKPTIYADGKIIIKDGKFIF